MDPRLAIQASRQRQIGRADIILGASAFLAILIVGALIVFAPKINTAFHAAGEALTAKPPPSIYSPRFFEVIDGDTVQIWQTGQRIQIANIYTAETEGAKCAAERTQGEKAKAQAQVLVGSARTIGVRNTGRVDAEGRTIAFLEIDGRDFGKLMMETGLARRWTGKAAAWCGPNGALLP